jgi:hypothetical membrane protein
MIRKLAFWSAIFAYGLLLFTLLAAPLAQPGYSHVHQYIAELGALGAPNGALVSYGGFLPVGLALMVFAALSAIDEPRSGSRWAGFAALGFFGSSYVVAALFPCDPGCPLNNGTLFQQIHAGFGVASYAAAATGLMLLSVAARRWPAGAWLSPLATVCGLLSIAAFFAMDGPFRGVAQRLVEGALGVWIVAYAITLRRRSRSD